MTDDLERAIAARGLGLGDLQARLRSSRLALSPARAWLTLARVFLTTALGELCLLLAPASGPVRGLVLVLGWLVTASGLAGLFVIGHDCGHGSFARRAWVNTLVGHLCMSPTLIGFHAWRRAHAHHHAHAQLRKEDPDWPEQMISRAEYERAPWHERLRVRVTYGSIGGMLVGFVVGMVRRTFMRWLYPQVRLSRRARRELLVSNAIMLLASGGIIAGLWWARGPWGAACFYGVPMYIGSVIGGLFTYVHHLGPGARVFDREGWSPLRGQVVGTFDVRFPPWFEWLFLNINRHIAHHVEPRVPWYCLPAASDVLARELPELAGRRFGLRYLARGWAAPLLDERGGGAFETGALVRTDDP